MGDCKSLACKLSQVMKEVGYVPKKGYNDFHKYNYVMEADLVDAIRDKLAEQKVFVFSSVDEIIQDEVFDKDGALWGWRTRVKMTFTLVDGESGEQFSVTYYGTGDDKGDKGAYKAYTGAVKYFLMKSFLVATGDDPEADTETDHRTVAPKKREERRNETTTSTNATAAQLGKIRWLAKNKNLDNEALAHAVQELTGKPLEKIDRRDASKVIEYLDDLA
jgi:hypothetical protein